MCKHYRGSTISCSDYAEVYEHTEDRNELESGQVLVLDPDNEGKVKLSTQACSRGAVWQPGNADWQY